MEYDRLYLRINQDLKNNNVIWSFYFTSGNDKYALKGIEKTINNSIKKICEWFNENRNYHETYNLVIFGAEFSWIPLLQAYFLEDQLQYIKTFNLDLERKNKIVEEKLIKFTKERKNKSI